MWVLICGRHPRSSRLTAWSIRSQLTSTLARSSTGDGVGTSCSVFPTNCFSSSFLDSKAYAIVVCCGILVRVTFWSKLRCSRNKCSSVRVIDCPPSLTHGIIGYGIADGVHNGGFVCMFTRGVYALVSLKMDLRASLVPRGRVLCPHPCNGVRDARKCNTGAIKDTLRYQCT